MNGWSQKKIEDLFELDVHELGELADSVNRNNGNVVTFIVNRHINYTNVCVSRCPLCAFSCEAGDDAPNEEPEGDEEELPEDGE